jgi:hypothetical protein
MSVSFVAGQLPPVSLVKPSFPGAFLKLNFFKLAVISSAVSYLLLNFRPNFPVKIAVTIFSIIRCEVFKYVHLSQV